MKKYWRLAIVAVAAFLTACGGTQIQLTEAIPASINLKRGSVVTTYHNSGEQYAGDVVRCLLQKINEDGYYKLGASRQRNFAFRIREVKATHEGKVYTDKHKVQLTLLQEPGERAIYQSTVYSFIGTADDLADEIYKKFTPHENQYYVRVKTDEKNPLLVQAVAAFNARNVNQARQLTQAAMQQYPDDPEGYFMMGLLERNEGNYSVSTQYFQKAYSIKPNGKYQSAVSKNKAMEKNDQYVQQQLAS